MGVFHAIRWPRATQWFAALLAVLFAGMTAQAQTVSFSGTYSQNFDSMGTSGTTPPTGWSAIGSLGGNNVSWATAIPASGSPSAATAGTANGTLIVSAGTSGTSNTQGYNLGASGSSDRALGTSPTSGAGSILQLRLVNDTGTALGSIRLGYDIRRFTAPTSANELPGYWLFYSIDNGATWVNVSALNPVISGGTVNMPNAVGVTAAPLTTISFGAAVAQGSELRLRWVDDNALQTSPDQIIGLDNVSITLAVDTPTLTAASTANVDTPFSVTYTDDATWRAAITGITVGGTTLTAGYTVSAGSIAFTPSASAPASLLQSVGSKSIAVIATGYGNATVTQPIGAGAANKLAMTTQPGAPAQNGGDLAPQPVVAIQDQYGNATPSTETVTASVSAGNWMLGGSASVAAVNGMATFADLTATAVSTVTDATVAFSAPSLTGVSSETFVITVVAPQAPTIRHTPFSPASTNPVSQQVVAAGSVWKYLDNGTDQGTAWQAPAFDDSAWASGAAPLGYGDSWIVTTVGYGPSSGSKYITTYFRRHFTAPAGVTWTNLHLGLMRDDGPLVHLNGAEILRDNMPAGAVSYLTWSSSIIDGSNESTYHPFDVSAAGVLAGDNVLAAEIHQRDGTSSDLSFDLTVTLLGYSNTLAGASVGNVTGHSADLRGEVTHDGTQSPRVFLCYGTADGGTDTNLWQHVLDLGVQPVGAVTAGISGLEAGTLYSFRYLAVNDFGQDWADETESFATQTAGAPTVNLTSPYDGSLFNQGESVPLSASAADESVVTNVSFFVDGLLIGSDTAAPYTGVWTAGPVGSRELTAVAWDDDGLSSTSAVATVTVNPPPNLPPAMPTVIAPTNGATGVAANATLTVGVSDPEGDSLNVTFYGRQATNDPAGRDFTIAVLPDTQNYSTSYPLIFQSQTDWLVANHAASNIVYVAGVGDIVNTASSSNEYWNATNALYRLENPLTTGLSEGIPWGACVGNHDMPTTLYNTYFGVSHFEGKSYYGGHYGSNNDSHYDVFSASGLDFIVLYLTFGGGSDSGLMAWANGVLQANAHRRAIVVSHSILNTTTRPTPSSWTGQGQVIFDGVKANTNVFLMLCGHMHGEGFRQETLPDGRKIDIILADYQDYPNGGNGWLRLMTFSPSNNVIRVRTYSPYLGQSQATADSLFDLSYNLSGAAAPFAVLGTNTAVSSGSPSGFAWSGLTATATYEWYAVADDGESRTAGPVSRFTAVAPVAPVDASVTNRPYMGVLLISRTRNMPRPLTIHVADIDLDTPGLRFRLTPPSGRLETTTQTTLDFLAAQRAQLAFNVHFFTPWPMTNLDHAADLVGLAASDGAVFSSFEDNPPSPHAIRTNAPALNIDAANQASIVHRGATPWSVAEPVTLWNTLAGSEQILAGGTVVAENNAWNNTLNPRSAVALASGNRLLLVTVDGRQTGVSEGMTVSEVAAMLADDYGATEALNLDGGGSTTLAVDQPTPHVVNSPSDSPARSVGSSLAVFAVSTNWLASYGLHNYEHDYLAPAAPGAVPAWQAYWLDVAPTAPGAGLRIAAISNPAPASAAVTFPSSAQRVYTLQYRESLTAGAWQDVPGRVRLSGTGGALEISDPLPPAATSRFYRVAVDLP